MSRVRVSAYSVSLDGFGAGPDQSLQHPLGVNGHTLHEWFFPTRTFVTKVMKQEGGEDGPDEDFAARSMVGVGAWILGRNMFTTSRGPWTDDGWTGWWGPNPPYHAPTFVLTHHEREPLPMEGGTTFHFATGGIEDTLQRAFAAADGKDVRLMGGATSVRQYLGAGLVDELHLVLVPMLIGAGERVFPESSPPPGYTCVEHTATERVVHLRFERR